MDCAIKFKEQKKNYTLNSRYLDSKSKKSIKINIYLLKLKKKYKYKIRNKIQFEKTPGFNYCSQVSN